MASNKLMSAVLKLPIRYRRRLRRMASSPRKKRETGSFSREGLLDFMRRHNIHSPQKLLEFRASGDPVPYSYMKEFGSWKLATRAAFGSPIVKPGLDEEYVIRAALMMGIKNHEQYVKARRDNPEILPSVWVVRRKFTTFKQFMVRVRGMRFDDTLEAYNRLWRRLGKPPTLEDCKRADLMLDVLLEKVFKTKDKLDLLMKDLNKVRRKNERQRRGA